MAGTSKNPDGWRRDRDGAVMRMAIAVVRSIRDDAATEPDLERADALHRWAGDSGMLNRLTAMVELARHLDGLTVASTAALEERIEDVG